MTRPLSLLFGVHAHQPAGNFAEVLEGAHERCYWPFLRILHDYPEFRFSVHFSGPLLDYLFAQHPDDMKLLEAMVARGQVEIFGAGDTEPVLASIPERDRIGQVTKLSKKLSDRFGHSPHGAWLTERVWEATVVPALVRCGIHYVTVDDYHFLCTGRSSEELDGYFSTEEDGHRLDLFPISEALRYRFPFSPAEDAVAYLETLADRGQSAAVYFDDIEKFGIWPETFDWVYTRGWLKQFIERVIASKKIVTRTFREYHAENRTRGIVYLPTTSYIEMNEWTLPPRAAAVFDSMVKRKKSEHAYDAAKPFLRGGIWKNFLSRYPEANWMHKRMTALSKRLADCNGSASELEALLYNAQANDAYWHGLFGGVYLPHLRRGIYHSLVQLEAALDRLEPREAFQLVDLDHDGCDELFLHSAELQAVVKLDGRAGVCELDAYELGQNFADTFRRYEEHYHKRLHQAQSQHPRKDAGGIASAHDRFHAKHAIAETDLVPDSRARASFVDTWWPEQGAVVPVTSYLLDAQVTGREPVARFVAHEKGIAITKRVAITGASVRVEYVVEAEAAGRLQVELDIAMPSADGFSGRFMRGAEVLGGFGSPLVVDAAEAIVLDDRFLDGHVAIRSHAMIRIAAQPYFTVSQSEDGLEKIMQSVTLALSWPVPAGMSENTLTLEALPGLPASEGNRETVIPAKAGIQA